MSLDQRLSEAARQVAGGVIPPDIDVAAVRGRARAASRRTALLVATAVVVAIVGVGTAIVNGRPTSAPPVVPLPTPTPTPTEVEPGWSPDSVTAEEVVTARAAKLAIAGIAVGDAHTRIAVWASSTYTGVALTKDGYASTTYLTVPGVGEGGYTIRSPRDDLFLVLNSGNGWLVAVDGTVRSLVRKHASVLPEDDRMWFQCSDEGWRETWCALDPESATAYVWPKAWAGSAVPPGAGALPWGANPEPRAVGNTGQLEVWWGAGSARKVRTLASAQFGDYLLGCPRSLMALWSTDGGSTVKIHTSRDRGATWKTASYRAPTASQWWKVRCAPDGSYLAVDSERGTVVWHAEAGGGSFEKVFAAPGPADSIGAADLWTHDGHAYASGPGVVAISDDSGRTWTRVRKWR